MSIFDPQHRSVNPPAQAAMAILRLSQILNQMQQRCATRHGITPIQMRCLLYLANTRHGACSVTYLTKNLGVTQATISDAVQALINKGFLCKCKSQLNRRVSLLTLTDTGLELHCKLREWASEIKRLLGELPESDLRTLCGLLDQTVRKLSEAGWGSSPEVCNTCGFFRPNQGPTIEKANWCSLLKMAVNEEDSYKQCPEHSILTFSGKLQRERGNYSVASKT